MDEFKPKGILFSLSLGFWSSELGWVRSFDLSEKYNHPELLITSFKKTSDVITLDENDVITMTYEKLFEIVELEGFSGDKSVKLVVNQKSDLFLFIKNNLGCVVLGETFSCLVTVVNINSNKKPAQAPLFPPDFKLKKRHLVRTEN